MDKASKDKRKSILNIGAGREEPLLLNMLESYFLVNLDIMYDTFTSRGSIECDHKRWETGSIEYDHKRWETGSIEYDHKRWETGRWNHPVVSFCNESWGSFLAKYKVKFDRIVLYRYLEHVRMTQVPFFIYMMSTVLKVGGYVEVIVPNYEELARWILKEDVGGEHFESINIMLTTELLNEPEDPHSSIWTPKRAKYFFELEGRFQLGELKESFEFDGRDIYMWFVARRVK